MLPARSYLPLLLLQLLCLFTLVKFGDAQDLTTRRYDIGSPTLTDIWVDPILGNDAFSGSTRGQALKTVTAAWNKVPRATTFTTTGYRIMLVAGTYPRDSMPHYWEQRYGTAQFPLIIQAADGQGSAVFNGDMNVFDVQYLYLIDFDIDPQPAGDPFHCEQCDYVLLRGMDLSGGEREAHETIKINQSQHIYIEECNIHGSDENNIDYVGVQYGHIIGNTIHNAADWCVYLKGGSAQIVVEANEIYNCGTGGFTAGQGTGLEFMTSPWLHYESYDIKFINNVVHDTFGAGFGVNGGYNILLAYNTLYRVGQNSHSIEVVYGLRSCDGNTAQCASYLSQGAWGTTQGGGHEEPIPNRNVFIYNNILYNPPGFQSQHAHFSVQGPRSTSNGSNMSPTIVTDTNLQIKGNILWNGPSDLPLGIEESDQGCRPSNPTCNATQLRADNAINTVQPQLQDPASGNFKPITGGNVYSVNGASIPSFAGGDRVAPPTAPVGELGNSITRDYNNLARTAVKPVGAFAGVIRARRAADGYLIWNSFLSMINIAELVNKGNSDLFVRLTLYNTSGESIAATGVTVPAFGQRDIILNDLVGFPVDSYGLVTLDYSGDNLSSRLSFYKASQRSGSFEFAYTSPLVDPLRGKSYVSFNTIQPSQNFSDQAFAVNNWISITNVDPARTLSLTVNRYNQAGERISQRQLSVAPFGRVDLEGGHEVPGVGVVGLNEIIPADSTIDYFATLVRYGTAASGFAFAYPLQATTGAAGEVFIQVSSGGGAQNWVELLNTSSHQIQVSGRFYNSSGATIGDPLSLTIRPYEQFHINANSVLESGQSGLLRLQSSRASSLVAQSMFYFYDPLGGIEAMYGSPSKTPSQDGLVGSYNLFLGMFNWLKISNTTASSKSVTLKVNTAANGIHEESVVIPARGSTSLAIHDTDRFETSPDSYGLIDLTGSGIIAEMIRIKPDGERFDYVFPTPVDE